MNQKKTPKKSGLGGEIAVLGLVLILVTVLFFYRLAPRNPLAGCIAQNNIQIVTKTYNPAYWLGLWAKTPTKFKERLKEFETENGVKLNYAYCPKVKPDWVVVTLHDAQEVDPKTGKPLKNRQRTKHKPKKDLKGQKKPDNQKYFFDRQALNKWLVDHKNEVKRMKRLNYETLKWEHYDQIVYEEDPEVDIERSQKELPKGEHAYILPQYHPDAEEEGAKNGRRDRRR